VIIQLLGMSNQLIYAANLPANITFITSRVGEEADVGVQINGTAFDAMLDASAPAYSFWATWLTGAGTTADYEVRCTVVSGTIDATVNGQASSSTGVWLPMNSIRRWAIAKANTGTRSTVITLEVRSVYSGTVLDTGTYTLTATVT
jgi:hypothetical protein